MAKHRAQHEVKGLVIDEARLYKQIGWLYTEGLPSLTLLCVVYNNDYVFIDKNGSASKADGNYYVLASPSQGFVTIRLSSLLYARTGELVQLDDWLQNKPVFFGDSPEKNWLT